MSQKSWKIAQLMGGLSLLVALASCTATTVAEQSEASTEPDTQELAESASDPATDIADASADPLSTESETEASLPTEPDSEIDPSDAFTNRTDANGNVLPEIVDGLVVGMDYEDARSLIIGDIWAPKTVPPANLENIAVKSLYDAGYEEIRDCAGTGLGLCRMEFIERDGLVFVVVVTTSEDTPKVWTWSVE
ncbi:hypothetical protein QGP82_02170 [Leptothoe sp. LEGE 181152]|nr:hypothetical protein [Leptothoe sp. LEGE 181152]